MRRALRRRKLTPRRRGVQDLGADEERQDWGVDMVKTCHYDADLDDTYSAHYTAVTPAAAKPGGYDTALEVPLRLRRTRRFTIGTRRRRHTSTALTSTLGARGVVRRTRSTSRRLRPTL
jgi:hypothetical protein